MNELEALKAELSSLKNLLLELLPENKIKHYDDIPLLLPDFALWYLENFKKQGISKETYVYYLRIIRNHLNLKKALHEITVLDLQKLLNILPKTRIKEVTYILVKELFSKAYELKMVNENVGAFLKKGKIHKKKIEAFKLKEQIKIFKHSNLLQPLDRVRVYVMLFCGLRPAEMINLDKSNLTKKYIFVYGTKTKNAVRQIPISKKMFELLSSVKEKKFLKCDLKKFRKRVYKYFYQIKVEGTLYMFRHTYATNMHYLGHVQRNIQHYMGHASSILTMDVYTSFDPDISKKSLLNLYTDWYIKAK